jgi:hypothetical protein
MLKQRVAAANAVRDLLIETERGIEEMMASTARRAVALLEARSVGRLPITAGQEALEHNAQLLQTLIQARRQAGEEHMQLAQAVKMLGLTAYGDQSECPPDKFASTGEFDKPRLVA